MKFHENFNLRAKRIAQLADGTERLINIRLSNILPLGAMRRFVKGPDLEGLDAVSIDQLAHDLFRLFEEVVPLGEASVVNPNPGI